MLLWFFCTRNRAFQRSLIWLFGVFVIFFSSGAEKKKKHGTSKYMGDRKNTYNKPNWWLVIVGGGDGIGGGGGGECDQKCVQIHN